MRPKQLAIILVLLVALGGIALLLRQRSASSWSETATASTGKVLNFQLNDVTHVAIKGGGGELNLVKKDEVWKVGERFNYPAAFDKVAGLIRKLWELHPAQDVKVGPSQFAQLQLTEPSNDANSALLVDLFGSDEKRLAALLLGKKQLRESAQSPGGGIPAGRYIAPQDGSNRVFLIAETIDEAQTKPEQWLDREFIKIDKPKVIDVAGPGPAMKWKLVRDNESTPWKFADAKRGEELDPAKASAVANLLANPTFADVLDPKTPPAQSGLDKPSLVHIETFDNFVYELRIGKLMGDNYPVAVSVNASLAKERAPGKDEKPEDKATLDQQFQTLQKQLTDKLAREKKMENWSYLIAKGTVEQLVKDRTALLAQKTPSPSPPAPHSGKPPSPTPSRLRR